MKKTFNPVCGEGFTLIEMIIYIAIAAVVLALAVNSLGALLKSFNDAKITSKINNSAEAAMERIARETRNAYAVNLSSVFGSSPGRLKLDTYDVSGATTTVDFYLDNGKLTVAEGSGSGNPLTLDGISVSNLVFRQIAASTTSKAVKIEMTVQGKNFYNTAILRGSY
jgi:prepilin-type N-terminal cleavage/methylation domain-containing protein